MLNRILIILQSLSDDLIETIELYVEGTADPINLPIIAQRNPDASGALVSHQTYLHKMTVSNISSRKSLIYSQLMVMYLEIQQYYN